MCTHLRRRRGGRVWAALALLPACMHLRPCRAPRSDVSRKKKDFPSREAGNCEGSERLGEERSDPTTLENRRGANVSKTGAAGAMERVNHLAPRAMEPETASRARAGCARRAAFRRETRARRARKQGTLPPVVRPSASQKKGGAKAPRSSIGSTGGLAWLASGRAARFAAAVVCLHLLQPVSCRSGVLARPHDVTARNEAGRGARVPLSGTTPRSCLSRSRGTR